MGEIDLDAIDAAAAKAMPGPWTEGQEGNLRLYAPSTVLAEMALVGPTGRANLKYICLMSPDMARALTAEIRRLREALVEIRDTQGKVCNEYETCRHLACTSSHRSWEIAEAAIATCRCASGDTSTSPHPPDGHADGHEQHID